MPDDAKHYESEVTRVGRVSDSRWALAWLGAAALVVAVGLASAIVAPPPMGPVLADGAAGSGSPPDTSPGPGGTPAPGAASFPPLIIESTDFHANGGAAYYGIGGKLMRALAPTPSPRAAPSP